MSRGFFDVSSVSQVLSIATDGTYEWLTLWSTNSLDKAESNARKRSKENPEYVFRAIRTSGFPGNSIPRSSRYSEDIHAARYFVAGERQGFTQPREYSVDVTVQSEVWVDYMMGRIADMVELAGQTPAEITIEEWHDDSYRGEMGWYPIGFGGNPTYTNIYAVKNTLSSKRQKYAAIGKDLTRVSYKTQDGEEWTEFWLNNDEISEERAETLVAGYRKHKAWRDNRIVTNRYLGSEDGSSFGGSHRLGDFAYNAFGTVGLEDASKAMSNLQVDFVQVAKHGRMSDEERSKVERVAELMAEASKILSE